MKYEGFNIKYKTENKKLDFASIMSAIKPFYKTKLTYNNKNIKNLEIEKYKKNLIMIL